MAIIGVLIVLLFRNAYISYQLQCEPEKADNGTFIITGYYEENNDSITICVEDLESREYERTLKHELVHQKQAEEGRLYDCSNPLGVIINEFEAYFLENF